MMATSYTSAGAVTWPLPLRIIKSAIQIHEKDCLFAATVIKGCGWRLLFNQSVSRSVCRLVCHPVSRNINGRGAANLPSCLLQYQRTWSTTE